MRNHNSRKSRTVMHMKKSRTAMGVGARMKVGRSMLRAQDRVGGDGLIMKGSDHALIIRIIMEWISLQHMKRCCSKKLALSKKGRK